MVKTTAHHKVSYPTHEDAGYVPRRELYWWQFADPMIVLVLFCSFLAFVTLDPQTGTVLLLLGLAATVIGFAQEYESSEWPPLHRIAEDHRRYIIDLVWSGSLIIALATANYLLFFWRNGLSVSHVSRPDIAVPFAMTLTYLTIGLCLFAHTMQLRGRKTMLEKGLGGNQRLVIALVVAFLGLVCLVYVTSLQPYLGTAPLSFTDWLWAGAAAGIYIAARGIHRHANTHYSREKVLQLHRQHSKRK